MPLSKEQHDELCVSYASLILFDGEAEITSDALMSVITASGNEVEPYWPTLFAGFLSKEGRIMDLITSGGPSAGGGGAAASGNTAAGEEDATAAKDEPKEEEADMVLYYLRLITVLSLTIISLHRILEVEWICLVGTMMTTRWLLYLYSILICRRIPLIII